MAKLEMNVNNPYHTKAPRVDRCPTVYRRVMARLSEEGKNPGLVIPILIIIEDDYKTFGALTLNKGGSVSFFPDFFHLHHFDHLTLSTDFIAKKGHMTKVERDGRHKKFMHLKANPLDSGNYNLISFFMMNGDMLMDSPSLLNYASIEYTSEEERIKYDNWIMESMVDAPDIIQFPDEEGYYCIQFQVSKKSSVADFHIDRSVIEKQLKDQRSLEGIIFNSRKLDITTPENCDFDIHIISFRLPYELNNDFMFVVAGDETKKLLDEVEIKKYKENN